MSDILRVRKLYLEYVRYTRGPLPAAADQADHDGKKNASHPHANPGEPGANRANHHANSENRNTNHELVKLIMAPIVALTIS